MKWKSIERYPIDMSRYNAQRDVMMFCPGGEIVIGHGVTWEGLDEDEGKLFHSYMLRDGDRVLHPTHWAEIPKGPTRMERLPGVRFLRRRVLASKLVRWLDQVIPGGRVHG